MEGRKNDDGKLQYDLIPAYPLEELSLAYTVGAKNPAYGPHNWRGGMRWGRPFAAMMRHAWKWWQGESRDTEGQHHLASVAFWAFALMEYEKYSIGEDDRWKYLSPSS